MTRHTMLEGAGQAEGESQELTRSRRVSRTLSLLGSHPGLTRTATTLLFL